MVTVITINHMARVNSSGTDLDILTDMLIMVIEMAIVMGDVFNAGEIITDEVVIMGITEPAIVQQHGVLEIAGVGKERARNNFNNWRRPFVKIAVCLQGVGTGA